MSVLLVNGSAPLDGHTSMFRCQLEGLRALGLRPEVLTCRDPGLPGRYPYEGEETVGYRVPGSPMATMALNRVLPVYARRVGRRPGLIHVSDVYLSRVARYHQPVVASIADLGKKNTRYYPRSYSWVHNLHLPYVRQCRGVVVPSEHVRADVVATLGIPESRVFRVPLFSLIPPSPRPEAPRPPVSAAQRFTVGYVAVDRPQKNIPVFLDVLSRLDDRFRGELISHLSAGTERLARSLVASGRLAVRSGVPDLGTVYRSWDALLMPSVYEGYGFPAVEAMSQGVPVLAANRTSLPEVVGDGGRLLEPGDSSAWVAAVLALTEPGTHLRWAQRAWDRAASMGPEPTGRALVAAYRALAPGEVS